MCPKPLCLLASGCCCTTSNPPDRLCPNAAAQITTSRIASLQPGQHGFDEYGRHGVRKPHLTRAERQRLSRRQWLPSPPTSFFFFLCRTYRAFPITAKPRPQKAEATNEPVQISCAVPVGHGLLLHTACRQTATSLCGLPPWRLYRAPHQTRLKLIALWKLAIHISNFAGCDEESILQPVLHAEPQNWQPTAAPRSDGYPIFSSMSVRVGRSNGLGQNFQRHRAAMFQPDKGISSYGIIGTVGWQFSRVHLSRLHYCAFSLQNSTPPAHGKSCIYAANAFQSPAAFRLPDFVSRALAPRSHILVNRKGALFSAAR